MKNADGMECVRCGATAMVDGALMEGSSGGDVLFVPDSVSYFKRILAIGNRKIKAFACLHCYIWSLWSSSPTATAKSIRISKAPSPPSSPA